MDGTVRLPPNPIHEWMHIRNEFRTVQTERGENDPHLASLRTKGRDVYNAARFFIENGNGVLCRNGSSQKAIDWFEKRRSEPDAIMLCEPRIIELKHASGGGRVLEQPQILDLSMLISRQIVDIKRCVGQAQNVSPKLALLRGLASAKAVRFTPNMDEIKEGDIYQFREHRLLISLAAEVIDWLRTVGLEEIPTPAECCLFR